jgi:hypothetical protein
MAADLKAHAWAVLLTAHAKLIERIEAALAAASLPPSAGTTSCGNSRRRAGACG